MFFPNPGVLAAGASAAVEGQVLFSGIVSGAWIVPAGVNSVCAVAIGRGGASTTSSSGGGGALCYSNDIPVTPGETLSYVLSSGSSSLSRGTTVLLSAGGASGATRGSVIVGTGYDGGNGNPNATDVNRRGGGAGGYTSSGGSGGQFNAANGGGGADVFGIRLIGGAGGGSPDVRGQNYGGGTGKEAVFVNRARGDPALRIIWGEGRAFPNTNTGDV